MEAARDQLTAAAGICPDGPAYLPGAIGRAVLAMLLPARRHQFSARRERITAIIASQPSRDWSGHELALMLGAKPRDMLIQLGEWARLGFFTRTGFGTYKLNIPPAGSPSTNPPRP